MRRRATRWLAMYTVSVGLLLPHQKVAEAALGPECSWFTYQEEAQRWFDRGPEFAPLLDEDGDGVACGHLPVYAQEHEQPDPIPSGALKAKVQDVENDGTLTVLIRSKEESVRLIGVELAPVAFPAPTGPCSALVGVYRARRLLKDRSVYLEKDVTDRDDDDKLLRYVWFVAEWNDRVYFANEAIVRGGFAEPIVEPPDTKHAERLSVAGEAAAAQALGLWGPCGAVVAPGATVGGSGGGDIDCADFLTQAAAQAVLSGDPSDPHQLELVVRQSSYAG